MNSIKQLIIWFFLICIILSCYRRDKISKAVINLEKESGFNYDQFCDEQIEFLIEHGILKSRFDSDGFAEFFLSKKYCKINYSHYIRKVDNSLGAHPGIGAALYKTLKLPKKWLENDICTVPETRRELANYFRENKISEKNKIYLFVYQTDAVLSNCVVEHCD